METPAVAEASSTSTNGQKLKIDFSWGKFTTLVSDVATDTALFKVKYHSTKPQLEFRTVGTDEITIGTGTLNYVSINAACVLRSRNIEVKALAHLKSKYTYLSKAFSSDPESRMQMTWDGDWGLKNLNLVCLDDKQEAKARLKANLWGIKKIASIEFADGVAISPDAREEIVVTGMTVMYTLAARSGNILSLFGAAFARPGPVKQEGQAGAAVESEESPKVK